MNVKEMTQAIRIAFEAEREPVMLRGAPGIGKSAGMLAACAELAKSLGLKGGVWQWGGAITDGLTIKDYFGYIDVRLSQCDPVDVGGLPVADHETGSQARLSPAWFPHTRRDDLPDYGIVALEEIVSAPQSVQAAAYQLTLDRRINDTLMKAGWGMVLTGNRMTDGGVVFKMPTPLANRVTHLDIETHFDTWREWAIDAGIDMSVIAFVSFRPDLLNTFDDHVKKRLAGDAFATERTWEKASKYCATGASDAALLPMLAGCLSEGVAAEFYGFRKVWHSMPNIDAILLDPKNAPLPDDAATQYAVAVALGGKATPECMDSVCIYAERFTTEANRPEIMALCIKDATRRNFENTSTKGFNSWAIKYQHLLVS